MLVEIDADLESFRISLQRINDSDRFTFLDRKWRENERKPLLIPDCLLTVSAGDRFYRVDKAQEKLHFVRDVASSEGEIFVLDSEKRELDVGQFPRSPLVDKQSIPRRRIQSDNDSAAL